MIDRSEQNAPEGAGGESPKTLAGLLLRGRKGRYGDSGAALQNDGSGEKRAAADADGQMNLLFAAPVEAKAEAAPKREEMPAAAQDVAASRDEVAARDEGAARESAGVAPAVREVARERRVWTVRALVGDVRRTLEGGYEDVWVQGEISNCRPAPSGHVYFTLKDGDAQLAVVLFRRQAQLLRFAPRDGMEVLARGRISLFDQRGQLQLIAETLEPRGAGSLQLAFEQLKAKLLAEGLFEAGRKRPLPQFPQRVGVITSPAGAVVHDIIRVVRRRHACLDLVIFPAAVQGPECAASVMEGLRWFNRADAMQPAVDVIVIARGGGSLEDLAGFNDEALARAIAESGLPVVSAVGHETDFTIADFVADLRAPTPSAAAELITAAQHRIEERVLGLGDRLERAIRYQMILRTQRFTRLSAAQMLARVRQGIDRRGQQVDELRRWLDAVMSVRTQMLERRRSELRMRVDRHDPRVGLLAAKHRLEWARRALDPLFAARVARGRSRLAAVEARLHALSPLGVLRRGYALVYGEDGRLLRDAAEASAGETIRARLERGSVTARVVGAEGVDAGGETKSG